MRNLVIYYSVLILSLYAILYPAAVFCFRVLKILKRITIIKKVSIEFGPSTILPVAGFVVFVFWMHTIMASVENNKLFSLLMTAGQNYEIAIFFIVIMPFSIIWCYNHYLSLYRRVVVFGDRLIYITYSPFLKIHNVLASEIIDVKMDSLLVFVTFDKRIKITTTRGELELIDVGDIFECYSAICSMRGGD